MEVLLDALASFPTAIWTVLSMVVVLYWLLVAFGLMGVDLVPFDGDADLDVGGDAGGDGIEGDAGGDGLFAFGAVPITIVVTSISIVGLGVSTLLQIYVGPYFEGAILSGVFIAASFIATLLLGAFATTFVVRPLKPMFRLETIHGHRHLIGGIVSVTSSKVTDTFGTAEYNVPDSPGNELQLNVICEADNALVQGSQAVITDYDDDKNLYTIMPVPALDAQAPTTPTME